MAKKKNKAKKKKLKQELLETLQDDMLPEDVDDVDKCCCSGPVDGSHIPGKSRVLHIYSRLLEGKVFTRDEMAEECNCSVRIIQDDIEEIRNYLADRTEETGIYQWVEYSNKEPRGYRLNPLDTKIMSPSQALLVIKILLDSRALIKSELNPILDNIIEGWLPKMYKAPIKALVGSEQNLYVSPKHGKLLGDTVWSLGKAIRKQFYVNLKYAKLNGKVVERKVMPLSIMVNDFYFYLIGFIKDSKLNKGEEPYPVIFRIDRIQDFKISRTNFKLPYKAFEDGEFRKRIQFMYNGPLKRIKLACAPEAVETVLDRLPTAVVTGKDKERTLIKAEVYSGKGLDMWLKSQEGSVELLESK